MALVVIEFQVWLIANWDILLRLFLQLLALSGSAVGRAHLAQRTELLSDLLGLLHTGSERVQRQVCSIFIYFDDSQLIIINKRTLNTRWQYQFLCSINTKKIGYCAFSNEP